MSHGKLAEIVVDFIEFLAAHLNEATPEERIAVQQAAKARLASLLREPDEYGYSPRKTVTPEHRALLESIISGEAYGWPPAGAT